MNHSDIKFLFELFHKRYTYIDGILFSKTKNKSVGCLDQYGYLKTSIYHNGFRLNFSIHRIIFLMCNNYLPEFIDHVNGNRLDNTIENLRAATKQQNNRNREVSKYSTSKSKGVIFNKHSTKPWNARIRYDGKMHSLGYFKTIEEASAAYKRAAEAYFGNYAYHNSRLDT